MNVREAIEHADLDSFAGVLAQDVVWIGLLPGQVCRNREQVLAQLAHARDNGRRVAPEIVLDREDLLVVDPHLEDSERHQVFVLRNGRVSEIRAYPERGSALAAVQAVEEAQW